MENSDENFEKMRGKPGVRAQGSGNLDANKELGQKVAKHEAMIREREIKKNRRRRKRKKKKIWS